MKGNQKNHANNKLLSEYEFRKEMQHLEESIKEAGGNYDNFLKKGFADLLYNKLGVCGGAYVFANKADNRLVYLHNKKSQPDLKNTYDTFIEIPYSYYEYDDDNYKEDPEKVEKANRIQVVLDAMYIGPNYSQPLMDKNVSSPKFYLNLPHIISPQDFKRLLPFEQNLAKRRSIKFIHCTVGEVIFNLFTWRFLVRHAQIRGLHDDQSRINLKDKYVDFSQPVEEDTHDFWEEVSDMEGLPESDWLKDLDDRFDHEYIREAWTEIEEEIDKKPLLNPKGYTSYEEYRLLGLVDNQEVVTQEFLALVRYVIHIAQEHLGWKEDFLSLGKISEAQKANSNKVVSNEHALYNLYTLERELDVHFQEILGQKEKPKLRLNSIRESYDIAECLNRVVRGYLFNSIAEVKNKQSEKIAVLIKQLHTKCRFPILPYFYQIAAGDSHRPLEHLVFSVWHSQENPIEIRLANEEVKKETAVAFVLLSIKPIWQIDPGINFIKNGKGVHCHSKLSDEAYIRLFRIYEFFRFLAQPIIDSVFYGKLIKSKLEKDYFLGYLAAFSHELSKVTDNIFEYSNVPVETFFGAKTDEVIQNVRKVFADSLFKQFNEQNIKKWRIIPNPDRFLIWSNTLRVWTGRRGNQIFEIAEDANLQDILNLCNDYSLKMYVGSLFRNIGGIRMLKDVIDYSQAFDRKIDEESRSKNFTYTISKESIKGLKLQGIQFDKDTVISRQNAFLRILLACITNIYEHAKGDFSLEVDYKKGYTGELQFVFLNPCKKKPKNKTNPSLGTEPVLTTCLTYLGGRLEKFEEVSKVEELENYKTNWKKKLHLNKDLGLWETRFCFPMKQIFV